MTVLFGSRIAGPATPRGTSSAGVEPTAASPATAVQEPLPTPTTDRLFMVLAPGALPDKAVTGTAADVLGARLRALGIGTFTSSAGYAITFQVPGDGPSDEVIRTVLGATGDVEFVPVPPDAYASLAPEVGDALPSDLPPLFGHEGIAAIGRGTSQQGVPVLDISLTAQAAAAFGDHTAAHVGEYFAIVVDGKISSLPVINEPIPGGEVQIAIGDPSLGGRPPTSFDAAAAILIGGRLPEAWQGARAPGIVTEQFAIRTALGQFPYGVFVTADLTAEEGNDGWIAVWRIVLGGIVSAVIPCPTPGPGPTCPIPGPTRVVVIDAERGNVLRIEYPPP
jgi:hypothetical protein